MVMFSFKENAQAEILDDDWTQMLNHQSGPLPVAVLLVYSFFYQLMYMTSKVQTTFPSFHELPTWIKIKVNSLN